jgi:hypothetical protein
LFHCQAENRPRPAKVKEPPRNLLLDMPFLASTCLPPSLVGVLTSLAGVVRVVTSGLRIGSFGSSSGSTRQGLPWRRSHDAGFQLIQEFLMDLRYTFGSDDLGGIDFLNGCTGFIHV